MDKYINYGDVNYMEYYGIWIKRDESDKNCYYFVKSISLNETCGEYGFILEEGYIDLSDNWVNWDEVYSTYDLDNTANNEDKVICLLGYYSIFEFGTSQKVYTKLEALEFLESYGIELDQTSTEYKKEIATKVFDFINDMMITLGTNSSLSFEEDEIDEDTKDTRKQCLKLEELETKQDELCEKFKYEYEKIEEYLQENFHMAFC